MANALVKSLSLFDRYSFSRLIVSNGSLLNYEFGGPGEILKNNIYHEWHFSNVTNVDESVYPFSSNFSDPLKGLIRSYKEAKLLQNNQLPFGIVCRELKFQKNFSDGAPIKLSENIDKQISLFEPLNQTILRSCTFVSPTKGNQMFLQKQRNRKIWWRKFSANPGRFSLTDIKTSNGGSFVEIQVNFPWGKQTVETIHHYNNLTTYFEDGDLLEFGVKDGRKTVVPHLIETTTSLDQAVLVFLCDAYEDTVFLDLPREVLRFHRKLAPYKITFAASPGASSTVETLRDLSLYLAKKLRTAGISSLLLPDVAKKSLESQILRSDELGIPYVVVLNDTTLKNGIFGLRSRDTTLKEQVHISKLQEYMLKILKNY